MLALGSGPGGGPERARAEDGSSAPVSASVSLDEFWSLSEYVARHPGEQERGERFATRVATPPAPPGPAGGSVRIALVYPVLQTSSSWRRTRSTIRQRLERLGVDVEIKAYLSHPGTELRTQAEQIAAAVETDPDYLVFTVESFRHRQVIERLISRKRPKVILDGLTTPVRTWGETQPFLYVGFNDARSSRLLVRNFLSNRPGPERYAIFYAGQNAMHRTQGELIRLALAGESEKVLAARYYVGSDRNRARRAAIDLLSRDSEIGFIFSTSSEIALGVDDAIAELGLTERVSTNGWGATPAELERLRKGRLDATLMPMSDETGIAIAEAIALDLAGRAEDVPQVFAAHSVLLDRTATRKQIAALKRRAFRYSR